MSDLLIHTPFGRDAELISRVMNQAGVSTAVCPTMETLCASVVESTGAVLISQEALTPANVPLLAQIINSQAPWSDLPLIVTTTGGEATETSRMRLRLMEPLGNVSLLERPLRIVTLVSSVQIALRARKRQYQLKENFAERERLVQELERSNEELAQFAHIVSHDLQAPIRMVKTFSQLFARRYGEKLGADADTLIQSIQNGASLMEELVRTLLNYACVGQEPITRSSVPLQSVAEEALLNLQPNIEEAGAAITCGTLPVVSGDHLQLLQLIQNLLGNALKYGRTEAKLLIHIDAASERGQATISVADNGPGIAAEYHERIFQPLKRLHGREISGTGMGLAVCRKIVERHKGRLWVESAPGQGAKFLFTLALHSNSDVPQ